MRRAQACVPSRRNQAKPSRRLGKANSVRTATFGMPAASSARCSRVTKPPRAASSVQPYPAHTACFLPSNTSPKKWRHANSSVASVVGGSLLPEGGSASESCATIRGGRRLSPRPGPAEPSRRKCACITHSGALHRLAATEQAREGGSAASSTCFPHPLSFARSVARAVSLSSSRPRCEYERAVRAFCFVSLRGGVSLSLPHPTPPRLWGLQTAHGKGGPGAPPWAPPRALPRAARAVMTVRAYEDSPPV